MSISGEVPVTKMGEGHQGVEATPMVGLLKTVNCRERLRNFWHHRHTVAVHDHDSVQSRFPALVPQPRIAAA